MRKALAVAFFLATTPAFAQDAAPPQGPDTQLSAMPAGAYTLDPNHTSITWKVMHMGLSHYTARFAHSTATIVLDPADVSKSTLAASIDPTSIRTDFTGNEDFDGVLAKDEKWFNAVKFPEIKFVSTRIEKTGAKTGKIYGDLTLLGVTKPLVLSATFNGAYAKKPIMNTPGFGVSATATLKRSDWGMGSYIPLVGDEVTVVIETELQKAAE